MQKYFSLVDCNNFYVSCERVFRPSLSDKPVVILSNNDGCIVARSNQAKALGIPMGAPYHQHKQVIQQHAVEVFSSNYQLYGDMSERVMRSLSMLTPHLEIYSIDEAFIRLDTVPEHLFCEFSSSIREKLLRWTGIPTSFGIAPTKTLAKIANHIAKKQPRGVWTLCDETSQIETMRHLPVEEIWGISYRLGKRLRSLGIATALELRNADIQLIRTHFNVVLESTLRELRGEACLDLQAVARKKSILSSKSFGKSLSDRRIIEEALASHAARACQKLRKQGSKASGIAVFLRTNPFRNYEQQYHNSMTLGFPCPSNDTGYIIKQAKEVLRQIYRQGYNYHKCGILLLGLQDESYQQQDLFANCQTQPSEKLMQALDSINESMGAETIFHAAQGTKREWCMKRQKKSPSFTTNWGDLLEVS